ncbi:MAG: DUF4166 domain-containing protein [Bacteroidia bacterium]
MTSTFAPLPVRTLARKQTLPEGNMGIFRKALAEGFDRMHPMMQARFGMHAGGNIACVGEGEMTEMKTGNLWVKPFLFLGAPEHVLFPEKGKNIPFVIENYPYRDAQGRESITFVRTFYFPKHIRRFDAYMSWDEERDCVVDYLGRKQRLVTDLHMEVDSRGHVIIRSGRLDWVFGKSRLPAWPGGYAEVEEWYDESEDRMRIRVSIAHPRFGRIYSYEGWFRCTFIQADSVPDHVAAR